VLCKLRQEPVTNRVSQEAQLVVRAVVTGLGAARAKPLMQLSPPDREKRAGDPIRCEGQDPLKGLRSGSLQQPHQYRLRLVVQRVPRHDPLRLILPANRLEGSIPDAPRRSLDSALPDGTFVRRGRDDRAGNVELGSEPTYEIGVSGGLLSAKLVIDVRTQQLRALYLGQGQEQRRRVRTAGDGHDDAAAPAEVLLDEAPERSDDHAVGNAVERRRVPGGNGSRFSAKTFSRPG
jgi:hypothetical protein